VAQLLDVVAPPRAQFDHLSLSRLGHDLARVLRQLRLIDFDPPRCVHLAVGPRARPGPADTR